MNKKSTILLCLSLAGAAGASAQQYVVSGTVRDAKSKEPVEFASAALLRTDSTVVTGATTDEQGRFTIKAKEKGKYIVRISYVGFDSQYKNVELSAAQTSVNIGTLEMGTSDVTLGTAVVSVTAARVEQKADTTMYNASAYRVPEGSTLEALIKQLPGVEIDDDGTIKWNGKEVKEFLINGKDFFKGDTETAMKNLPTELVSKIKAYDKASDYTEQTGIDDGEETTVLDITTKKKFDESWVSNVDLAYGTKDRYSTRFFGTRFTDNSRVTAYASANNVGNIAPALRDRMEMINIPGYLLEEKVRIALDHLLPKQCKAHGIPDGELTLTPEVVEQLISGYTREAGVRSLDKHLAKLARARAKQIAFDEPYEAAMSAAEVERILGMPKFLREEYEVGGMTGVVTGLAWTEVGGDILYIESCLTPGKGRISLTGNLGDVMKESATIAHEWVMAHYAELGIDPKLFETNDINIHVPEGAIPKDGPSAGITMVTSMVSTYTGRKVKERIAMTGETTLRGRVMPVGGVKEKILAAKRAGITDLILSEENRKDIAEIKPEYIEGLTFHYVRTNDDVLRLALEPADPAAAPVAQAAPSATDAER